ncbi:MAG: hypothetical protein M1824_000119 [Vezdaea acicularis]|nr:MAG: hypothetical protein M1824_000119 [Vezdaea acicularis]
MSSKSLQEQTAAFRATMASSGAKFISTHKAEQPNRSPSHASATNPDLKRKRDEGKKATVVYSQPADIGTGTNIMTQVTYAVDRLKSEEKALSFDEIVRYLSLRGEPGQKNLAHILRRHERIEWKADSKSHSWNSGTFRFKPIHNIHSGTELLTYLQSQRTAQGILMKELKEGWSAAEAVVDELESEGKLLVTRNKKDNHARAVWPNDPSLSVAIDDEFRYLWHRIVVPKDADLPSELVKLGLQPTSSDGSKKIKTAPKPKEKKQKKRRVGKTTNNHLIGVLRDYSNVQR